MAEDVCGNAEALDEIELGEGKVESQTSVQFARDFRPSTYRCTSVQTSRRVVVADDMSASRHHLQNTNTLPLATRDAANEFVTDEGLLGVSDVEHLQKHVEDLHVEGLASDSGKTGSLARCLGSQCEFEGLFDSEGGDVDVICVRAKQW